MTTHTIDNFVDTSGTALENHTPDSGGPWSNLGGDAGGLQISSTNKLSKVTTTNGAGIWAVDTGADDHYAKITINSGSSWPNSTVYLAVRVQDASNCYYLGHNSATGFFIRKFVAGSFTNLVTFTSTIATGDVFELDVVGNVLTAYRNGSPISGGSVTDTTGAGGGAQFPTGSKSGLIVVATASAPNMFTKFEADAIGGGTSYSLTASAGSFALTGKAANLNFNRSLSAAKGAFSLTGKDAGLVFARRLSAGTGSFTLTGNAAALAVARRLAAGAGAFVLTGNDADLLEARKLFAGAGAFTLTGQDASLTASSNSALSAGAGAFVLSGQDASLLATRFLLAAKGSFALTGKDAGLAVGRKLSAGVGAFELTGNAASLRRSMSLLAQRGQFTFSGQQANLLTLRRLSAAPGSFILTGNDAGLEYSGEAAILVINADWLIKSPARKRAITSSIRKRTLRH